jgi:hypothetical protein
VFNYFRNVTVRALVILFPMIVLFSCRVSDFVFTISHYIRLNGCTISIDSFRIMELVISCFVLIFLDRCIQSCSVDTFFFSFCEYE